MGRAGRTRRALSSSAFRRSDAARRNSARADSRAEAAACRRADRESRLDYRECHSRIAAAPFARTEHRDRDGDAQRRSCGARGRHRANARRKNRKRGASLVAGLFLFYRPLVRPLRAEPVRTSLTVLAIALGVSVVPAIDLAGFAAAGSFRSSMETLAGNNDFEIVAAGGVPEDVVGKLAQLPYSLRISARIEDYAAIDGNRTVPLLGLDLVSEGQNHSEAVSAFPLENPADALKYLADGESVWVGQSLGYHAGDRIPLLINDRLRDYTVRGVFPDDGGNAAAIVMDLAAAQRALGRFGYVDRILVKVPEKDDGGSTRIASSAEWEQRLRGTSTGSVTGSGNSGAASAGILPEGVDLRPAGTGTDENRKMLAAFRWNLKLLSYIALVVGAFLIYNTISVSVVRRRAEIGIVRALGASRATILTAFIGEAASLGFIGALIGVPLGRVMASGAVKLMSATVDALYVSSRPGTIALSPYS